MDYHVRRPHAQTLGYFLALRRQRDWFPGTLALSHSCRRACVKRTETFEDLPSGSDYLHISSSCPARQWRPNVSIPAPKPLYLRIGGLQTYSLPSYAGACPKRRRAPWMLSAGRPRKRLHLPGCRCNAFRPWRRDPNQRPSCLTSSENSRPLPYLPYCVQYRHHRPGILLQSLFALPTANYT